MTFEEAKALADAGELIVADVREEEEFVLGHVTGATLLPLSALEEGVEPSLPIKKLAIYCRTGRRSAIAAEILKNLGYEVYDLGSIVGWTYGYEYGV